MSVCRDKLVQVNSTMLLRAFLSAVLLVVLSGCETNPIEPPTPLESIKVESKLGVLWSRKIDKSTNGRFEPTVVNNVVYAASSAGEVIAIDQASGATAWYRNLKIPLSSGVGGADSAVFVSSDEGTIYALNPADGKTLWTAQASSEVLVPVSAGFGSVVVRSADGRLLSLDPKTGAELWSVTYTPPALTLNGYSQPLLVDGGVLVGLDDGRLVALNSSDGSVLWESIVSVPSGRSEIERLADIDGNVRVDDSAIYAVNYQGRLARIEPVKGDILWSVPMSSTAGLNLSESAAIVVSDNDEVKAFDRNNGQLLWTQFGLKHRHLSAPQIIANNLIVVGDMDGYLHIIDNKDGRLIGRKRIARKAIFPEMSLQQNTLLVQAADGTVVALRAQP